MKTLKQIAIEQHKKDAKQYSWMEEGDQQWISSNLEELQNVKNAILKGRLYLGVDSVSSSGMSRTIVIKYIKNNHLHAVSDLIYQLAGCDKNRRIRGCGMDMLFAAQYNLFVTLCPRLRYQDRMPRYNQLM